MIKTKVHILDIIKRPASRKRDLEILETVPCVISQLKIWSKHLNEALCETRRMYEQFGSNPVEYCEQAWLECQCLAIGSTSR